MNNRDGQWGHVVNGTWNGMISSVLKDEADFIMASLTYTLHRFTVIDYLYPIGKETPIMVIKRGGLEEVSWLTFFKPFRNNVWYMLLLNTVFLLVCVTLLKFHYAKDYFFSQSSIGILEDVVRDFWTLGSANLGWQPANYLDRQYRYKALRILLMVVFLCSSLTFMSYKASLTAELAVRRKDLPFSTLEHLLSSEYRSSAFYIH